MSKSRGGWLLGFSLSANSIRLSDRLAICDFARPLMMMVQGSVRFGSRMCERVTT